MDFLSPDLSWPGGDTDSSGFPVMTLLEHIYNTHTTGGAKVAVPDQELHTRGVTVRFPRVAEFNILLAAGASHPVIIKISELYSDVTRISVN